MQMKNSCRLSFCIGNHKSHHHCTDKAHPCQQVTEGWRGNKKYHRNRNHQPHQNDGKNFLLSGHALVFVVVLNVWPQNPVGYQFPVKLFRTADVQSGGNK